MPFRRASLSCSITQRMLRFLSPGLSSTCCDENFPSFFKSNFMPSNAIDIAIINTQMTKVSIIFLYFCGKDSANRVKCKIKSE